MLHYGNDVIETRDNMSLLLKGRFNKVFIFTIFISLIMSCKVSYAESITPVKQTPVKWKAISVGVTHSLAVQEDGTVWAWGSNSWGEVGNGKRGGNVGYLSVLSPAQVKGIDDVKSVAAGSSSSFAIKNDGTVWAWGSNMDGGLGIGTETTMESTKNHPEGEVIINNDSSEPVQVKGISDVISIVADFAATYALKKDGTVWGWGYVSSPYSLEPVQFPNWTDIKSITTGYGGNLEALKTNGTVIASDRKGGTETITGVSNIVAIAAGSQYTYGLKDDGTVWFWGSNGNGLFNGESAGNNSTAQLLKGIDDVVAIQATAGGPLLLKKDGTLWASGDNIGGQLGIGSYNDSSDPIQVKGLIRVKTIAANGIGLRSMAIKSDGSLWSWGNGNVGDGTKWYRTAPVWIKSSPTDVQQADQIIVEIDSKVLEFDQPPLIIKDHTMVPLRTIFESLGAEIKWDQVTSTITASKGDIIIKLSIGSNVAYVNDQKINLASPPLVINNRTLVPTRFIGESLGASVTWENASKTVFITSLPR
jgi:alpha-tubulin suppressor-like RCC1 family protein